MCSDTLDPGGEVRGCSAGCTIAMSDVSPFVWVQLAGPYRGFPEEKNCFLMWVCVGCGGIISCSDWHKIVLFFPLHAMHVILKVVPHTAHRRSLLSAARSSSSRRHVARSSTVRVESSDTMRSRNCLLYTSPSPRDKRQSRMPSSA